MTTVTQFYPTEVKVEMSTKSFIFERGGLFLIHQDKKYYNSGNIKLVCYTDFTVTKTVETVEFENLSGNKISLPLVNFNLANSNFKEKAAAFLSFISNEETGEMLEKKQSYVEEICNENLIELSLKLRNKEMFEFLTNTKNRTKKV